MLMNLGAFVRSNKLIGRLKGWSVIGLQGNFEETRDLRSVCTQTLRWLITHDAKQSTWDVVLHVNKMTIQVNGQTSYGMLGHVAYTVDVAFGSLLWIHYVDLIHDMYFVFFMYTFVCHETGDIFI